MAGFNEYTIYIRLKYSQDAFGWQILKNMGLLINKEIEIKITVAKYFLKKSRGPPAFLFLKKYKTICHIIKKRGSK